MTSGSGDGGHFAQGGWAGTFGLCATPVAGAAQPRNSHAGNPGASCSGAGAHPRQRMSEEVIPSAARAASRRATGTRNGEQDT